MYVKKKKIQPINSECICLDCKYSELHWPRVTDNITCKCVGGAVRSDHVCCYVRDARIVTTALYDDELYNCSKYESSQIPDNPYSLYQLF